MLLRAISLALFACLGIAFGYEIYYVSHHDLAHVLLCLATCAVAAPLAALFWGASDG